jgi:glycosyltransferase involved in cell wall biosynthesis
VRRAHALGEQVDTDEPRRRNAGVGEGGKPPAGAAAGVQHEPLLAVQPGLGAREQAPAHFLAQRDVPRVLRAPGALLAGVLTIPLKDVRGNHGTALPSLSQSQSQSLPPTLAGARRPVRVLLLTHYYPPEVGAAPARIAALARGLAERGMEVTVHTGFPHYPSGTIARPHRNRLLRVRHEDGVRVVRSVVYPTPNRGFARRLVNHAVFAAGALLTGAAAGPVDVVVAETPPLFTALAGVLYARCKRARLALNVSDLWPESAVELGAIGEGSGAARAAAALARLCYRHAALIAAPTRGIVESLGERPQARGKVVRVPPAVDLARFAAVADQHMPPGAAIADPQAPPHAALCDPQAPRGGDAPLRVLYAGTLGMAQGLGTLVEAAALAGPGVVEVRIAGEGPDALLLGEEIAARGLENVRLLGAVAPELVPGLYAQADAGVVPLRDLPIFAGALPSKLFEVLAAGRPAIVAAGIHGEAATLIREAGAGLVVAPEDAGALAEAFRRLRADPSEAAAMGRRGRLRARDFDRAAAVGQWESLLRRLAVGRPYGSAAADRRRGDSARALGGSRGAP